MSIRSQITRLENAKSDILSALKEKGVNVPTGVLLDGVADLIKQVADKYLTVELDDGTTEHLSIDFDNETSNGTDFEHYISISFN